MRIRGRTANYHKLVFEVRYAQGFTYLDRCGAAINRIQATDAAWVPRGEVNPQGSPLVNAVTGTQLNFNVNKYDFGLDQPIGLETALTDSDITAFMSQVSSIAPILHEELSLTRFLRKGFRVWFIFPTESEEDSNQWLASLGAVSIPSSVVERFSGSLESQSHVLVIRGPDRKFRVSIAPVERLEALNLGPDTLRTLPRTLSRGQREAVLERARLQRRLLANPTAAVMVDVDVFVDEPIEVDAGPYLIESLELLRQRLPQAFGGER